MRAGDWYFPLMSSSSTRAVALSGSTHSTVGIKIILRQVSISSGRVSRFTDSNSMELILLFVHLYFIEM